VVAYLFLELAVLEVHGGVAYDECTCLLGVSGRVHDGDDASHGVAEEDGGLTHHVVHESLQVP